MPTIAVIGASADRSKFGNRCVRAYAERGWIVYPVNPRETILEGLPVYRSILDTPPGKIDRVSVYLPDELGLVVMEQIAQRGDVHEVMLNPGADGPRVVEKARAFGLHFVKGCALVALGAE